MLEALGGCICGICERVGGGGGMLVQEMELCQVTDFPASM